jgi:hypothetical protein
MQGIPDPSKLDKERIVPMEFQPTGIIKCLPKKWYDEVGGEKYLEKTFRKNIQKRGWQFYQSMACIPKYDVLHCYLLINGFVRFRLNIVVIESGGTMLFRDRPVPQHWNAKYWMILSAPVVEPSEPMPMRGFQGFRYTDDLFA